MTRWLEYFSNIWTLKAFIFCQSRFKDEPSKNCQRLKIFPKWQSFAKSGRTWVEVDCYVIRRQPGVSTQVGISVENPEEILIVNTLNIIVVAAVVELWLLFPEVSSSID